MARRTSPAATPSPAALAEYARKRDFRSTPEPGADADDAPPAGALRFVVQKHWASRLHPRLHVAAFGFNLPSLVGIGGA